MPASGRSKTDFRVSYLTAARTRCRYNVAVIKSLIILVLLVLLTGGAFLSRPTKQAFEAYAREQLKVNNTGLIGKMLSDWQVEGYLNSIEFKDRYLWVEVAQNGKTQFVGAFSKFFSVATDEKPTEVPNTDKK